MLDGGGAGLGDIEGSGLAGIRHEAFERGLFPGLRYRGSVFRFSNTHLVSLLIGVCVAGAAAVAWQRLHEAATATLPILWTLAPLLIVHAAQITLAAAAWSKLLCPDHAVPISLLFRLRVIRESVDSLLPIAQVGGEMIASAALVRSGVEPGLAAGSIMVDMVLELLGQLGFLTLGCFLLSGLSRGQVWSLWLSLGGVFAAACAGLLAAHRLGALRLVESLIPRLAVPRLSVPRLSVPRLSVPRLARHVTATPAFAIAGLHEAVTRLVSRMGGLAAAVSLHFLHWLAGTVEVLIVLRAMGVPVGPGQAIIMNAIGVGARSAGFMVPGSLVVQESGFMLGAALAGLPPQSALVFSLVRRLRELAVGGAGIALWRAGAVSVPAE